ncbi:hypothetical protein SBOR_6925 [Sclerotinia borealis F-4128]|uniref:Zinc knuckle-domain-containing protein n=1 Tax=Sclerotinia borealis (strain F-4128) TaxID=1432307 RepID=W9CCV8_SCLBF|nr:hypothetical protein SBOR_6925 [Sclerotinia borealis F-4128]
MNRYHGINRAATIGGPSKASASTMCQKCLKKDIYECKANAQERPYVSRPSRTQQLANPKLIPKLTSDIPQDLLKKKGIADEQLAKLEKERGRKRERQSEDMDMGAAKRRRSASSASSVSTISTNISRSPSREARRAPDAYSSRPVRRSHSPSRPTSSRYKRRTPSLSPSPPPQQDIRDSGKKRRRDSFSSVDSYSSRDEQEMRNSRERANSRSTRKKFNDRSPNARGRRTESRSPYRGRRGLSNDRRRIDEPQIKQERRESFASAEPHAPPPKRERSMSPFSKRLELTQAMNTGR